MTDHGSTRRPPHPHQAAPSAEPAAAGPERTENGSSTSRRLNVVKASGSAATGGTQRPVRTTSGSSVVKNPPVSDPAMEVQATVITKSPALAQYPLAGLLPRDMGQLLEGQRLGHFELIEYVGGGGMGAVFRAMDTMLNRVVAVKVLSQEQSSDEETLRRFQNEAQSAARLDHENISRVYYVGEDGGWHYIVFEFIEGVNLRDLVERQGALSLDAAVSYTLQIADALTHASRRDVVHRDIKPSNVLITPDQRAKLVDMGLARLHQVEPGGNDLTASGVTLGTFDYISPEQARDPRNADVRSDIYSLGCTFYFMLTSRPPFPYGTVLQKLLQHQGDEPPDPREFRDDLPDDLVRIVWRMLAKSPERRYQTPDELVADLLSFAANYGLRTTSPAGLTWLPSGGARLPLWERNLPWLAPLVVLIIVVLAMNFAWSGGSDHAAPPPLRHNGGASGGASEKENVVRPEAQETPESRPIVPADEPRTLSSPDHNPSTEGTRPTELHSAMPAQPEGASTAAEMPAASDRGTPSGPSTK